MISADAHTNQDMKHKEILWCTSWLCTSALGWLVKYDKYTLRQVCNFRSLFLSGRGVWKFSDQIL